jgi:hypothetical protein
MFKRLFGAWSPARIRKQASDLRPADYERFPVWEFCLDEERVPGQDECTVRPFLSKRALRFPNHYVVIASTMRLACGRECFGTINPGERTLGRASRYSPELWLDRPAGEYVRDPVMEGYNPIVWNESPCIGFTVPEVMPEDKARALIAIAYRILGVTRDQMWPLTVRPRHAIAGWPESWTFDGWECGREGRVAR